MPQDDTDPFLDTDRVGERAGVAAGTIRTYLKRSRKRIEKGLPLRAADLPLPDETAQRSPLWRTSVIDAWLSSRPGRGKRTPDRA